MSFSAGSRFARFKDAPRQATHWVVEDAECSGILFKLAEILPIGAEFAGQTRIALRSAGKHDRMWRGRGARFFVLEP